MRQASVAGTLLFHGKGREDQWREAFRRQAPQIDFRDWPDWGPECGAEFALVWKPPPGELARQTALKAIFSVGAGIDHLTSDPDLPRDVPVIRMVDPSLTAGMSEFVVLSVLRYHRDMDRYTRQQRRRLWQPHDPVPASARSVGVMGAGLLGRDALDKLCPFGFRLRCWSSTPRDIPGVSHFHGADQFAAFLNRLDVLVCLLPLTRETQGILNHATLSHLADGAAVIGVGRGEHLVEKDLLGALESGKIGSAVLDVFPEEPLPRTHPFWHHPKVTVTPHIASMTSPQTAVAGIVHQIERYRQGKPLVNVVDIERGY